MSFLTLNGLPIPIYKNSFREVPRRHGDVDVEAADGTPFEVRTNRLRRWTCRTPVLRGSLADLYMMWLEAWGHGFNFESKGFASADYALSNTGMGNWMAGTMSRDTTTKKRGASSLSLGSGIFFAVSGVRTMTVRDWAPTTHGWTLMFWAYHTVTADSVPSDGWYFYIVKGAVDVERGDAADPTGVKQYRDGVLGSYGLGNVINVETGPSFFGVAGYTLAGVAAAKNYDDLFLYPFELDDGWVSTIASWAASNTMTPHPAVRMGGDCVRDEPNVIARETSRDELGADPDGDGFTAAAYELELELREVP